MSYGTFKSVEQVARKFDIEVMQKMTFIQQKEIIIIEPLFTMIAESLKDRISFINEATICERIISPMLTIIANHYQQLHVWSHVPYNVDEEKGLVGEPDYLIAPQTKYGSMEKPSLCVIEAKRDDFDSGWTQALAEMVASSILGAETCYAMVTTGKIWEFGQLEQGRFTVDPASISAADDLQKTFNKLNWLFEQIAKK